jgi:esterase/lipase superfamily enzyme
MRRVAACLALSVLTAMIVSAARADWVQDVRQFAQAMNRGNVAEAAKAGDRLVRYAPDQTPMSPQEREELLAQTAKAMAAAGRLPRAAELYRQLVAAIETRSGENSFELLGPLQRLAEVEARLGRLDAAAALADRALKIAKSEAGELGVSLQPVLTLRREIDQQRLEAAAHVGARPADSKSRRYRTASRPNAAGSPAASDLAKRIDDTADQLANVAAAQEARAKATRSAPGPLAHRGGGDDDPFRLVRVFYGTNRVPTGKADPGLYFGDGRGPLTLGIATVSVPKDRKPGEIPLPALWRGDLRPDTAKHFVFARLEVSPSADSFAQAAQADIARSTRKEAFVFIHGYNSGFESAVYRTAQLAVDLQVDGAAFLYSWPSKGSVIGYVADGAQLIRPVARDLASFLRLVVDKTGAQHINIAAHSMGNRYLLEALDIIARDVPAAKRSPVFSELVFAAPDVDAEDFSDRVSSLGWLARRMTLYASSKDRALYMSSLVNGGGRRAGDASAIVTVEGLDTVDTTAVGGGGLGHGDFANAALDDVKAVVWLSLRPRARCVLVDRKLPAGAIYWMLADQKIEECPRDQFATALQLLRQFGPDGAVKYVASKIDELKASPDSAEAARYQVIMSLVQKLK